MKLYLALLLLAAVYVEAQYYGYYGPGYYDSYEEFDYPVASSYEDDYPVGRSDFRVGRSKGKGGIKKGGFWYYWGPQQKQGWGWGGGHGGHYGGHHGGHGGWGGWGGYGGHHGGGHHGGGHGGWGGWGWQPRRHIHHHQPHFPHGGPPTIVKHHGWGGGWGGWGGWGGHGGHGGHHGGYFD